MRGGRLNRWTEAENNRLDELRRRGLEWEAIAAQMPGRTIGACQQQYSIRHGLRGRRRRTAREVVRAAAETRQAPLAPVLQVLATVPSGRRMSTATLLADAELRARIELQGLTAGLLGDPMPGRSALDRKRRGGQ